MSLKRKADFEQESTPSTAKQLKLIPFPNYAPDEDSPMSEAEHIPAGIHHARIPSDASAASFNSSPYPGPIYPSMNPTSFDLRNGGQPSPPIGLMQPHSSFAHHGNHCTQIPKLRIACSPGLNGSKTMWSFCENCGAISMVEND